MDEFDLIDIKSRVVDDITESVADSISIPLYRVRMVFKDAVFNMKSRVQRFMHGYSDYDVWNMYDWFIETVGSMLRNLLETHKGHPASMTDEEYKEKLSEMIRLLDLMNENNAAEHLGIRFDGDVDDIKAIYAFMNENKDKFFIILSELFFNLWD